VSFYSLALGGRTFPVQTIFLPFSLPMVYDGAIFPIFQFRLGSILIIFGQILLPPFFLVWMTVTFGWVILVFFGRSIRRLPGRCLGFSFFSCRPTWVCPSCGLRGFFLSLFFPSILAIPPWLGQCCLSGLYVLRVKIFPFSYVFSSWLVLLLSSPFFFLELPLRRLRPRARCSLPAGGSPRPSWRLLCTQAR